MVVQEGVPALTWRPAAFGHVLRNARLRDLKPELEQFAMDPWRTPQRIIRAHLPDQCAQACVDLGPTCQGTGFPTPVPAETGTMPAHKVSGWMIAIALKTDGN